jgi:hypothetical protein
MKTLPRRSRLVTWSVYALSVVAIPHLIDDFLFDIPREFGISIWFAQILAGVFTLVLVVAAVLSARDKPAGYRLCAFLAIFLILAVLLRHLPLMFHPGPYWSGIFSEMLILGVLIISVVLLIASAFAILERSEATR